MRSYFTAHDNQTKMTIEVYQGEGIYCRDNLKLGEVEIDVPRAARGQQGADVRFTYDINGILPGRSHHVSLQGKSSSPSF